MQFYRRSGPPDLSSTAGEPVVNWGGMPRKRSLAAKHFSVMTCDRTENSCGTLPHSQARNQPSQVTFLEDTTTWKLTSCIYSEHSTTNGTPLAMASRDP